MRSTSRSFSMRPSVSVKSRTFPSRQIPCGPTDILAGMAIAAATTAARYRCDQAGHRDVSILSAQGRPNSNRGGLRSTEVVIVPMIA